MSYSQSERSAILRGELRSKRFRFRRALPAVARGLGIPESWIHYWINDGRFKSRSWCGQVWVRLEDVQAVFNDAEAVQIAFWETADPITPPEVAASLLAKWPRLPKRMFRAEKIVSWNQGSCATRDTPNTKPIEAEGARKLLKNQLLE